MKHLVVKTLFFLSFALIFVACKKDKTNPKTAFDIYIDFWNPTGTNPQISLDEAATSKEIKIDFDKQFEGIAVGNLTKVLIDNFRIIDDNYRNYSISNITAYEFKEEKWKEDVEFTMSYEPTRSLSVVLVLDRSQSLGEDFASVKQFANDFVEKLFAELDNVQIGIVDFSTTVNSLPLTNNQTTITNYINELTEGEFTAFYDGVNEAIDMLLPVEAESKAILGFTDGTDNNSSVGVTSDFLYDKLINDDNEIKISSFMIGLEGKGGVDRNILKKLSANGGVAQFPSGSGELQSAFDNFSSAIANVYNLTYTRNQQQITEANPVKLKFSIQTE
jgi:Ca-activated chloride channel homolog